ncbi:uncharacterized protein LOC130696772 [Daphnia carinata]|uniref:uncharacterized protein LOC130696772 n=1 Tax=Daphnia carinata TaxID=120202 RepID=UPI002579FEA0|nr:uncharacterized protein LOC130696772 [Daphnia carinata]
MKSIGISKSLALALLILLPLISADGFKDHQLKFGYDTGEYRLLKWLNRIRGSDRTTTQTESQFEPIKIETITPEIQYNTSNFTQTQVFDTPQLAKATYSSVPQPLDNKSSSKSSLDSVEGPETRPLVTSVSSPSYRDYFYLKWFHGSPKATYFNETALPDEPTSVLDSKAEHGRHPTVAPLQTTNQEFNVGNIDFSDADSALLPGDSLLGKVLGKIKQMMPLKTQKFDIAPLKLYDEPPKPQLFARPAVIHIPLPSNDVQQIHSQPIKEVNPVPAQPVYHEISSAIKQSPEPTITSTTTENSLPTTSSSLPQPIPQNEENRTAEPSSTPLLPSNSTSEQPETKDEISERMSGPLQTMFYYPKRPTNDPAQLEEPAYSALELAFGPLVPAYP